MITTLLIAALLQTSSPQTPAAKTPSVAELKKELRAPAQRLTDEYRRFEDLDRLVNTIDRQLRTFLRGRMIIVDETQPASPDPRVQFAGSPELAKEMAVILDQYVSAGARRMETWAATRAAANAFDTAVEKIRSKMKPKELTASETWREQFFLSPERLNVRAIDHYGNHVQGVEAQFIPAPPPPTTTAPLSFTRGKPDDPKKK